MKKTALLLTACSVFALALAGCGDKKADQAPAAAKEVTITVGATPVPHADILKVAAPELKKQGVNLKVIEFTDYVKPNLIVNSICPSFAACTSNRWLFTPKRLKI